ncbi:MAG: DegQ family serine endoprotease [Alphaproteobacteria bacterium]|nr:DegQ family serine endoprotease [Alphaproteobacteria bacterium]
MQRMGNRPYILALNLLWFCAALVVMPLVAQARDVQPGVNAPYSFADLAEELLPSVVNVSSTQKIEEEEELEGSEEGLPEGFPFPPGSPFEGSPFEDFFEEFMDRRGGGGGHGLGPVLPPSSLGSGFVIDAAKGYIVTNNHVVRDADEVRVTFHDDSTIPAKIIGRDEKTDIAVLQVKTKKKLKAVEFGNSKKMRVGDWVVAIGNPFGLGGTVTSGIISARQRDINSGPYDDFIQTDASINRGNSGGPMFNLDGEVIGINTAIFSPSGGSVGIGFAIPANLAKPVINQLIEYGRTRRGWLGVRIQKVTEEIAESLGLDKPRGALVASVTEGGPAEKTKLKAGDIITEFDGKAVEEMRSLPRIVAETPIGKKITFKYWRDGKEYKGRVAIGELEKAEEDGLLASALDDAEEKKPSEKESKEVKIDLAGMSVSRLSESLRERFEVPDDVNGIAVTSVKIRGEASKKGLSAGDVIVEINQRAVDDPATFKKELTKAKKGKRKSVLLLVNRGGDVRFVALKLDDDK